MSVEEAGKKPSRWKRIYLSKGQRLTLVKSTLSSFKHIIPPYFLSQLVWKI